VATVRTYFEEMWNAHDLGRFDRFVAPEVRYHGPRGPPKGYEDYRRMAEGFFAGVPDLHFAIEEAVERDGLVALRIRITGTHRGAWRGVPATGRRIDVQGRPWLRVRDGKVTEVWSLFDELGAMQQVGAVPERIGRH
jgi:steroid delta-isomerase-like uncharacterized protein